MSEQAATFWQTYLTGAHTSQFPSARYEVHTDVANGFENDGKEGDQGVSEELAVDIDDATIVAAWALVVSFHCIDEDVLFALSAGSSEQDDLPFRVQVLINNDTRCSDFVAEVQYSLDQISGAQRQHGSTADQIRAIDETCKAACAFSNGLEIVSEHAENSHSLPLTARYVKSSGSRKLVVKVDLHVHSSGVQRALLRHWRRATETLSSSPTSSLANIDLFHDWDYEQVLNWTPTPEPQAKQPFLHKSVEEQVRLHPMSIAVGETDCVMTYAELDERATALARHLLERIPLPAGTRQGVGNIATFFSKSALPIVAMLAILKAGGAFIPIDVQWSMERIEKVLTNAQIPAVLCSEDNQPQLPGSSSVQVIPISQKKLYDLKNQYVQDSFPDLPLEPNMPAYIIHTSGSTGDPKGIEISHVAITTSLNAITRYFELSASTRTLQFNAFTFDVAVGDIFATLSRGGRLCVPSEAERFSLDEFIVAERCNFAFITPSVAATIHPDVSKRNMHRLATIGEMIKPDFLKRQAPTPGEFDEEDGEFVLCDTYGPAEASVMCTGTSAITVSPGDKKTLSRRPGNIGKPIGSGLFIVSAQNPHKLAPAYIPGEIALVGPTLATGYWGDEKMTNAAFRTDLEWTNDQRWIEKFGAEVMKRVYLTGDIGRYSEDGDGSIVFMHRRGGYVKVNGLRIDPGEVETALVDVARVANETSQNSGSCWSEAAVCVMEHQVGNDSQQMLVCFIPEKPMRDNPGTRCEKIPMSTEKRGFFRGITDRLKSIVPEYMLPQLFIPVTQMPYTASGKLDRKSLLALVDSDKMSWKDITEAFAIRSDLQQAVQT